MAKIALKTIAFKGKTETLTIEFPELGIEIILDNGSKYYITVSQSPSKKEVITLRGTSSVSSRLTILPIASNSVDIF